MGYSLDEMCVRLPVDCDEEPIHVGDTLKGYGKRVKVTQLHLDSSGAWSFSDESGNTFYNPYAFEHYQAPTVNDWLDELCNMVITTVNAYTEEDLEELGHCDACNEEIWALTAEYAEKFRLAGDA